jgi:hypothetical protein
MTAVEDRLRTATRTAAATIADGSAPPLRLPDPASARRQPGRSGRAGRSVARRWLAPAGAAVAVAAVIATVSLTAGGPGPQPLAGVVGRLPPVATAAELAGLPRYYATIDARTDQSPWRVIAFWSTVTRKRVASVRLRGTISQLTGNSSGFYAMVDFGKIAKFYRIQFRLKPVPVAVSELPIRGVPAQRTDYLWVSPNGRELAYDLYGPPHQLKSGLTTNSPQTVVTVSTATGHEHVWRVPASASHGRGYDVSVLSWLSDNSTLAYALSYPPGGPRATLRLLKTTAPGHNLLAASKTLLHVSAHTAEEAGEDNVSTDGHTLIEPGPRGSIVSVQLPSGHTQVLYTPPGTRMKQGPAKGRVIANGCGPLLWLSDSGSSQISYCGLTGPMPTGRTTNYAVLIRGGHVYRMPWRLGHGPNAEDPPAAMETAFP